MAINIYDKAMVVRKNGTKYYLVKYGSKNSFTIGGQRRIGNDLRGQWLQRDARDSDWHIVAWGEGKMAMTNWNAPTSWIYGRIMFGNKKNIALYLDKATPVEYESLDDEQKQNFDRILSYARPEYMIDLKNILGEQSHRMAIEYCGKTIKLLENCIEYNEYIYWNLDNL